MLQDIRLFSWQYALTEIIFVIRFLRSYIILDKAAILVSTLTCTSIQELPERVHGDRFLLQIALRCSPQIRLGWKPCRLAVVFFFLGFSVCESFGPRLGCYNKRMEKGYTCHDARPWKPTKRSVWIHKTLLQQFVSQHETEMTTSIYQRWTHPWCHHPSLRIVAPAHLLRQWREELEGQHSRDSEVMDYEAATSELRGCEGWRRLVIDEPQEPLWWLSWCNFLNHMLDQKAIKNE